jgi:hypothetical protein
MWRQSCSTYFLLNMRPTLNPRNLQPFSTICVPSWKFYSSRKGYP